MPCRAYWQSGNRHQGIQQSSNPAILLHDIPHLAINRCCLLICNSDFNFNKFLHQKICQRGFINFIGIQLVPEMGLGTNWIWFGLGFGGSKPQTVDVFGQYCPQQCVHMHVASCLLLLLCSALLCSRPFVSPSFVQSFNRKLYCLTHIYLRPPALLGHCVLCVLSLCPVGCHTNSNTFMTHANFQLLRIPTGSNTPPPTTHTQAHTHVTPHHARIAPVPFGKSGIPIRIVCVLFETHCRHAPLNSFDAVIWQFLADFSLTFGFDQLI